MGRAYSRAHIKHAMDGLKRWKIRKGDEVAVIAGREKGKVGFVKEVIHDKVRPRVVIDGVNLQRRPVPKDPNNKDMEGRSFVSEKAMHYSNVMVLDPVTRKPVRVGWAFTEEGKRVRVTRGRNASGSVLKTAAEEKAKAEPAPRPVGPLDTPARDVRDRTVTDADLDGILRQLDRTSLRYYPEGAPADRAFKRIGRDAGASVGQAAPAQSSGSPARGDGARPMSTYTRATWGSARARGLLARPGTAWETVVGGEGGRSLHLRGERDPL